MRRRKWILLGGLLLLALCPRDAEAQTSAHTEALTTGWVVELAVAANGATNEAYTNMGGSDYGLQPLIGLSLAILKRPIPYLSVGLTTYYGFLYPDLPDGPVKVFSGFLAVLGELRAHVPFLRFDPWVGVGFGYALAHTSFSMEELGVESTGNVALHGMGISVGAGFNFYVSDTFSIGPFFRMIFGIWPQGCIELTGDFGDSDGRQCEDLDDPIDPDLTPHFWSAGVSFTNTF